MSHTTKTKTANFIYNGNYDGLITIKDNKGNQVKVEFDDLKSFVANSVRAKKVAVLEQASDDELLGIE